MAIPEFPALFGPTLALFSDGKSRDNAEVVDAVANALNLSDADLSEMLPSGKQRRFQNRIAWAIVHLRKAGAIANQARGLFAITERGRELLRKNPKGVTMKDLLEFEEYRTFRTRSPDADAIGSKRKPLESAPETPDEQIERLFLALRRELAEQLLADLKRRPPTFFEKVVVDLLLAMGYGGTWQGAGRVVGRSGDGGIDGTIMEDKLGLDIVYVQAKRWKDNVGRPAVQGFAGSLEGVRARKGVMITTSLFSDDARLYVSQIEKKIVLIDGPQLADLMIEHGVGVVERQRYILKKIDVDYFESR